MCEAEGCGAFDGEAGALEIPHLTPVTTSADLVEMTTQVQGDLKDICDWIRETIMDIVAEGGYARVTELWVRPRMDGQRTATIVYLTDR